MFASLHDFLLMVSAEGKVGSMRGMDLMRRSRAVLHIARMYVRDTRYGEKVGTDAYVLIERWYLKVV